MARNVNSLHVYHLARELAIESYALANTIPDSERYGMRSQLQRAAVSVLANLVEGATRRHTADWLRSLEIAQGSAAEARVLIDLAGQLGFLPPAQAEAGKDRYDRLVRSLQKMIDGLSGRPRGPGPRDSSAVSEVPVGGRR